MGGKRRRRKRKQARQRKRDEKRSHQQGLVPLRSLGPAALAVRLQIEALELARGHDGLLRGMPEPTLLVGLYCTDPGQVPRLANRYLYRFGRPEGFPTKVAPREPSSESCNVVLPPAGRLVVLVLAVEEDSSEGLQILYAALEQPEAIVAWTDQGSLPTPVHLDELHTTEMPGDTAHRVRLMLGERDPAKGLPGDDWVGANLLWTRPGNSRMEHRFHFVSEDGRNDWTALIELMLRR